MTNLVENPVYEVGIYQLEESDVVQGGADGIDNLQAKQLANRTAYLKAQIEAAITSIAGKQASHANLTSLAGATAAVIAKLIELGGTTTVSVAELNFLDGVTSAIQTQLNAKAALASPALTGTPTAPTAVGGTNTTQLATTAFVQAAVAALINTAPGALDTLDELAAALGDDANFAATMTTALAGKQAAHANLTSLAGTTAAIIAKLIELGGTTTVSVAELNFLDGVTSAIQTQLNAKAALASPALTGTPTAPTAVVGTNTTQLATTAFVQAAVAALVASSPATLDTLNELAAALGDDPNFATTMTTALAGKQAAHANLTSLAGTTAAIIAKLIELGGTTTVSVAELNFLDGVTSAIQTQLNAKAALASPALTGTPTAPTAVVGTNTTQLATTAFVQEELNNIQSIHGAFKNLQASATGTNASVTVTCDECVLEDGSNAYVTARNVNVTINIAAAGENGLDTGARTASTWYAVWIIRKPDGTTAGILSLSSTTPTMPAGYTFKARVGWIRADSTANKYPLGFKQYGRSIQYQVAAGSNVTGLPQMASGSAGSTSTPTYVAVATGNFVPTTAAKIGISCTVNASGSSVADAIIAPNNGYGAVGSTTNPPYVTVEQAWGSGHGSWRGDLALESSSIYWASSGFTSAILACTGWEDNL